MRKICVGIATLAMGLSLTAPALAKGPGMDIVESSATVEGRGLAAPIHITSNKDCGVAFPCSQLSDLDDPLVNLANLTGTGFRRPGFTRPQVGGPLGPRYRVTYTLSFADGETRSLVQDVYPWAGTNGWIYTPKGQHLFEGEVPSGWTIAPTTLRATLIDLGIPSEPPPPVAGPVSDPAPTANPVPVIGVTSALLAALVAGAVILALARRRERPARLA